MPIDCNCLWKVRLENYMIADNITIQELNNHFAYTMDGILQGLCDFLYASI